MATYADLVSWDPCWGKAELADLFDEHDPGLDHDWDVEDVLALEELSDGEKVWVIVHMLPTEQAVAFAQRCADRITSTAWLPPSAMRHALRVHEGAKLAAESASEGLADSAATHVDNVAYHAVMFARIKESPFFDSDSPFTERERQLAELRKLAEETP